ncbi:hypothetical protein IJ847_00120 [Candidatus Saccharibacteria bacterium]|nr:hypothetical protein [Candidatus Saccharibacteria bacterium]
MQNSAFAATPPAYFHAFNVGYKDEYDSQNYDFVELAFSAEPPPLDHLKISYYNSAGNHAGDYIFPARAILAKDRLVLGFSKSPQFENFADSGLTYYFSDSGLASTAGKLELYYDDQKLDEVCWGKIECTNQAPKFSTKAEDNYSALREGVAFTSAKYYPDLDLDAISQPPPPPIVCDALRFTELLSYYDALATEQFIELQNFSDHEISLDSCALQFKKNLAPLSGSLAPKAYVAVQNLDFALTKNPSSAAEIQLLDNGRPIASFQYPHGQRKATSYALFDGDN